MPEGSRFVEQEKKINLHGGKKMKKVKKMVINGLSKINKGFAVLGDMETAYQLVLMYSILFGFDLYMPTLAIVLGSWFGYIGYVTDVSEITLKRNLGQDVTIEADDYRKEMVVIMGLTFVEFWTMWTGELTGEGVVLLFGYIAIQMLIVMMGMVLKDLIASVLAEKTVMELFIKSILHLGSVLLKIVNRIAGVIGQSFLNILERITTKPAIKKLKKWIKRFNRLRKTEDFALKIYEATKSACLVGSKGVLAGFAPFIKMLSYCANIGDKSLTKFDKEEGIEVERESFNKRFRKRLLKMAPVVIKGIFQFAKLAAGNAISWKVLGLMLFYIGAMLLIDFIKKAPIMISMWLAVEIVFYPPVRKQISRFSNKVDKWRKEKKKLEDMAV